VTHAARVFPDYESALVTAYEEEISGEGYFAGLAEQFSGRPRDALLMMARVERVTASALRPLVESHSLVTREEAALLARGMAEAGRQRGISWVDLTSSMADEYPVFMAEFELLSRLAPPGDRPRVAIAAEHELALIAFARGESAGDPGSLEPIEQFLTRHDGPRAG
jgi:hypothetical protein